MRVLIAPDSFKDCLPAKDVASYIAQGLQAGSPDHLITLFPLADGGEGTADCIHFHKGGEKITYWVSDPLGRPVAASCLFVAHEKLAVIEMASASGLELLTLNERDPMKATSYGTGELIRHALDAGMSQMLLTIGGSATVDGGIGMAAALGFRFLDARGHALEPIGANLEKIVKIDTSAIDKRIFETHIRIACDVRNVLNGKDGAAAVYGPQKGASPEQVEALGKGLKNLSEIVAADTGFNADSHPGTGAAGGLALLLLAYTKAILSHGFDTIAEIIRLDDALQTHQVIITGEGKIDVQTQYGKVVSGMANRVKALGNKTCLGVFGKIDGEANRIREQYGLLDVYEIAGMAANEKDSFTHAAGYLKAIGSQIATNLNLRPSTF